MIHEALALVVALAGAPALAEPAPAAPTEDEADPLSPYRTPFGVLVDRTIGTTSTPVAYNWRRGRFQLAAMGDQLAELNNFNSQRAGALVRIPSGGLLYEVGVSHVWVWDTPSSELLAYTPYRQPGRPARWELDLQVAVPLAEGVVTARPRFFPSVQMVLCAYAGLRYAVYPGAFQGMSAREVATALLSASLTDEEIVNLEGARLDAMEVDPGRYGTMIGLGEDLYFKQGLFVSPRVMVAVPILAPVSGTELYFWTDVSLLVGVAF